jgi:Zn-dependent protease
MMRRPGSIRLMSVLGIRVGVDPSWFVVLFLVIFVLSAQFKQMLTQADAVAYAVAVAAAFLLFTSIVAHELGHALAARREGIETTSIDLWFFGGLARLSRDSRTAGEEFRMAAAGPAVTLAIIILFVGIGVAVAGPDRYWEATGFQDGGDITPALALVTWLATVNVVLLLFNLVPAYPLDGGRIARALVWRVTGDRNRGTRAAARLGQGFAWVLMAAGVVWLVEGSLSGLYLLVLGFLFGSSARGAILSSAFTARLEGVRVADIMDAEPISVPGGLPLDRAHDEYFMRYREGWFPVVDPVGRLVGLLREERARHGGADPVEAVMEGADEWRVSPDQSLDGLLASEPLRRLGALLAVDGEGRLRGVVTVDQVRRAVSAAVTPASGRAVP